jgi:hypothetical protein
MKLYIFAFFTFLVFYPLQILNAQMAVSATVISSAGSAAENISGDIETLKVSHTIGEAVIFSASAGQKYVGQGFHSAGQSMTVSVAYLPTFDKHIRLYPNPAISQVIFDTDHVIEELRIFDMQGRLLQKYSVNDIRVLDVSALGQGRYFVQLKTAIGYYLNSDFIKI